MEKNNNIDTLYNLIETSSNHHQTFIKNLDLWKQFYSDRDIILTKNYLNPKLFTIVKFLLEQEHGEIFDYFHGTLLTTLKHHQEKLPLDLENEGFYVNKSINNLFANLNNYDNLREFTKQLNLDDPLAEVKQYLNSTLHLDTARTLIFLISNNFFMLDNELVKKTIAYISKSSELVTTPFFKNKAETREFIYKYLDNILKIKLFIGDNLSNDTLIKLIKNHQIQDKKVINYIFSELSINLILKIFDNDINNIIYFLNDAIYLDEVFKTRILMELVTEIIQTEDYNFLLLDIIAKNKLPFFMPEEIKNTLYNKIIINSLYTPIIELNSDMIKLLLNSEYKDTNVEDIKEKNSYYEGLTHFIKECYYLIRNEKLKSKDNFDVEGIKKILATLTDEKETYLILKEPDISEEEKTKTKYDLGLDIDSKTAIKLLTNYIENKITLTESATKAIVRSIAIYLLKSLDLEKIYICYHKSNTTYGLYSDDTSYISLNTKLITRFLNSKNGLYCRLKILNTMLHEITHALYANARKNELWTPEVYRTLKEDIIRQYDLDYYEENYKLFREEIEARINGINSLSKFIETFMPNLLDKIQDEIIEDLLTEKKLKGSGTYDFVNILNSEIEEFNLAFDTLISYNSDIIKNNPILNLEYYTDGTIKSYEDISSYKNEENKELIDDILKRRYPEIMQSNTKTGYKK